MRHLIDASLTWLSTPLPGDASSIRWFSRWGVLILLGLYTWKYAASRLTRKRWKLVLNVVAVVVMALYYGLKLLDPKTDTVTYGTIVFNGALLLMFLAWAANLGEVRRDDARPR